MVRLYVPEDDSLGLVGTPTGPDASPPPKQASTASEHPVQPSPAPKATHETDAQPKPTESLGRYYTYRRDVPLKTGEVLGFTPGKGYYAKAASPAQSTPSSSPPPTTVTSKESSSVVIAGAKIPQATSRSTASTPSSTAKAGGGGNRVRYYTYRREVPLKAGQTVGFRSGKGYYAKAAPTITAKAGVASERTGPAVETKPMHPVTTTGSRSLQSVAARPNPWGQYADDDQGYSDKYPLGEFPLTPVAKVVVTAQASATVSWSGGGGLPDVGFNPSNGDVAVEGFGVSFTDAGLLSHFANGLARAPAEAASIAFGAGHEFANQGGVAPFDVSIGGKQRTVKLGTIADEASLTIDDGAPAFEVGASTSFEVESPSGSTVTVKYAVTTTFRIEGARPTFQITREEVENVLAVTAGIVTALAITKATTRRRPIPAAP